MASSHPIRAKKGFGQHFLTHKGAVDSIVAAALAGRGDALLEIGPGPGVLTERLLADGRPLHAIELDPEACDHLARQWGGVDHFHLLPGDAVTLPLPGAHRYTVVGNLPYNVSTAILARFLLQDIPWDRLVFMFQLEVAQRILASPGEKAYGPLAVLSQLTCRLRRLMKLGPGAFSPPPKVDSAVVLFEPREDAPGLGTRHRLRRLLFRSFGHRRKTLANNWLGWLEPDTIHALLAAEGLSPMVRAEALTPATWRSLEFRIHSLTPTLLESTHDAVPTDL